MRSHVDLSMDQRIRIEESLTVDCEPPGRLGRHRGCGRSVGERCVNLATGLPMEGLGAHVDRLLRARALRPGAPTSALPSPRIEASTGPSEPSESPGARSTGSPSSPAPGAGRVSLPV